MKDMLSRIKSHNYLNGIIFALVEFVLTGGVLVPFTVYYFLHGRYRFGAVVLGIVLNCFTIAAVALVSLLKKEPSIGVIKLYTDPEVKKRASLLHPHMSLDTLLLCIAVLVPFCLLASTLYDLLKVCGRAPLKD